ncbi:MAG: sugar MFS transporter [Methylococcaceae bacterium]|nr:sugar MFS transporter [Methylococcaceae bacterium]
MWGFMTCLNDILIPHLKSLFILNYTQVMLVQFCFFAAYFLASVPSGYFVEKFNYQKGIITGLVIASLGCLLFYPAAAFVSYPLFLAAFFILASGITLLQVAANPYVTILGRPETASSRLTLTQAFNSLGTTLAPYFGGLFVLSTAVKSGEEIKGLNPDALEAYQSSQAALVQLPYLMLAASLFIIAIIFACIKLPDISPVSSINQSTEQASERKSAWNYRHLVLGALGIFVYVGAEVAIGSFLISYLGEQRVAGLSVSEASKYVSFYWGGAMLGRFAGAWLMSRIAASRLLTFNALAATTLLIITLSSSDGIAMWSILAIGLFNSIMFPTIFSLALSGLGDHTGQGSGILCAAIVGGAIVPVAQGVLADFIGIHLAFVLPAMCYCYIAYYGWKGYRLAD